MRIGLLDVDSHNFPNLPLMKISAWHKQQGDTVEWWDPEGGSCRMCGSDIPRSKYIILSSANISNAGPQTEPCGQLAPQ